MIGAKIALITSLEKSAIGQIADRVLTIPAPSSKTEEGLDFLSGQPMGSLFEQSLALTLDALILVLMARKNVDPGSIFTRHANLE